MPKTITPALQAFFLQNGLDGSGFNRADLITVELTNGDSLYAVGHNNLTITYGGNTYQPSVYGTWERGSFSNEATYRPNPNKMQLRALFPTTPDIDQPVIYYPGTTTPMMSAVNAGLFNKAVVQIQTLFWPHGISPTATFNLPANTNAGWAGGDTTGIQMGTMQLTVGQIGNVKGGTGRSQVLFDLYDYFYILTRPSPPLNIQGPCRNVLFDGNGIAGCGLNVANFTSTAVPLDSTATTLYLNLDVPARQDSHAYNFGDLILVSEVIYMCTTAGTSASSAPSFTSTRAAQTTDGTAVFTSMNGSYPLGYVTFTTGQNAGLSYGVKVQTTASGLAQLQLVKPTALPVASGDELILIPGCDKTLTTCTNVYNNAIHFDGDPFVPNPEVAGV
jgi:Phage conserved hypothetical protein BR0599